MQDKKDNSSLPNNALDQTAKAADSVKNGISISGTAAKGAGASLPGVVGLAGKAAGIVSGAIREQGDGWVEKAVCGTARVLAQGYAAAPLTAQAATQGAAMVPLPHPLAKAAGAVSAVMAAGPGINVLTKPFGEAAGQACHKSFDLFRKPVNPPETPPKQVQKETAQNQLTQSTVRHQAINGFRPNVPSTIPLAKYNAYHTPYRPYYHPPTLYFTPFNVRSEVNAILMRYGSSLSFTDKMMIERKVEMACSFMESQLRSGYSCTYGVGDFRSTLAMTGLMSSYNSYNIQSMVYEAIRSYGQIGGVAGDVSLIKDLIDSEAHAQSSSYFFCFPTQSFPFPLSLIKQLASELKEAYFTHKTLPFFSLHFNNKGFMYPVNHPAYSMTLTGEITALLDYWMKGFLNGGIFDAEFLKKWHELCNCDEQYLRSNLIDLKKYCKANAARYISLRELESRYGLKNPSGEASSAYNQPFMTSFRIIAGQEQIKRHGNILIPNPTFRVEYSIDLMPDYKEYIEKYHKEHGEYPKDYEHTRQCYELFAQEIKEKLPQMPFCRDYFQLLGVINSFCYAYATFDKMGKVPVIADLTQPEPHFIPKALPPIPVRYFHTYPIETTFGDIFSTLISSAKDTQEFDAAVFDLFSNKQKRTFPELLNVRLQQMTTQYIQSALAKILQSQQAFEINEEEIERITKELKQFLLSQIHQTHNAIGKAIQQWLEPVDPLQTKGISHLPLPQRITTTRELLDKRFAEVKSRWLAAENLSLDEILSHFPKSLHTNIKTIFADVDEQLKKELNELIYICKKSAGTLTTQDQIDEEKMGLPLQQRQDLAANFKKVEEDIDRQYSQELQNSQQELAQLHAISTQLQTNLTQANQALVAQQQHKATQIAQVPAHLRNLPANVAAINNFCANVDQQINQIQLAINSIQEKITLVNQAITQLGTDIADAPNKKAMLLAKIKSKIAEDMIAGFKASSLQAKAETYKQAAIHFLTQNHELNSKSLIRFTQRIEHFSQVLNGIPEIKKHQISKEYTHTLMSFTGQDSAHQSNEKFKIVGGCGMSLPNIQTKVIDNADEFSLSLGKALISNTQDQPIQFSFNEQNYVVYELSVVDKPLETKESKTSLVTELINPEADISSLQHKIGKEKLDPSGAGFAHYAAITLDGSSFAKISSELWTLPDSLGNLPLHYAAQSGNTAVMAEILKAHPSLVDSKNHRGLTPLFLAVQHEHIEAIKLLVTHKADANLLLTNGLFPLFVALQNNFHDVAMWFLDNVLTLAINQEIDSKMTALHLSIDAKDIEVATKLIEKGANCTIKRKSDGFTAVHCAAKQGLVLVLKAMQNKGVALHHPLESGKTPLHLAAEADQLEVVDFLLANGAITDAKTIDGDTPLMLAIKAGNLEVAQRLAVIATINTANNQKQSASLLAIQYGMPIIADMLIERGENPELLDSKGNNCIYYLIRNGEETRFSALLAAKKINTHQEFHGENALELAAKYGQFLIVYDLLAEGITYRKKANRLSLLEYAIISDEVGFVKDHIHDKTGTQLELACLAAQHGSNCCLTWLLKQLSSVELQHSNLLKASLESHQTKVLQLVLQRFKNINQPLDQRGNTALHLAAKYGAKLSISLLLQQGAQSQLRNQANHTVFHIAIEQEDNSLLKHLFKSIEPKEWPLDIWSNPAIRVGHPIYTTLAKFKKKLPTQALPAMAKQNTVASELPSILLTPELKEGLSILKQLFIDDEFDEAANLLEEQPQLLTLFNSEQGAHLLQYLFANICDYTHIVSALNQKEQGEDQVETSFLPHKLLGLLKRSGINPVRFTGKNNVLHAMLQAKTDEEACYRLNLFHQYFPESLAMLALDKGGSSHKIIETALKINKKKLFASLDELCPVQDEPDTTSLNSLHEAVLANNYELVANLLKRYPIDSLNKKRQTPLMVASALNNIRIMELLLDHGANPERLDIFGQNALHHALNNGHEEAALTLLPILRNKNRANRSGHTPLMLAATKGLCSVVKFLCEQNDDTESVDNKGFNALHHAALHGQSKVIRLLVSHGYAVNDVENPSSPQKIAPNLKRTAMHLAALHGHIDAVETLISLGADIEQEDSMQNTVFEYAVMSNKNNQLQTLQQLDGYHQKKRDIPMLLAAAKFDNVDMLSQLILSDVNLNGTNTSGLTALHSAAINNSIEFTRLLLSGKDVALDIVDQDGMSPLQYAAQFGHVGIIDALLLAGAKVNYHTSNRPTALFTACANGHLGAVVSLLKGQADFSITNAEGMTPAQVALLNGHVAIAKKLHGLGDMSLLPKSIAALPKASQDKLKEVYPLFEQAVAKAPIHMGNLLISQGIYRQKAISQPEPTANLSPTL